VTSLRTILVTGRDFERQYLTNSTLFLLEFTLTVSYSLLDQVSIIKLQQFATRLLHYGCSGVTLIIFVAGL